MEPRFGRGMERRGWQFQAVAAHKALQALQAQLAQKAPLARKAPLGLSTRMSNIILPR